MAITYVGSFLGGTTTTTSFTNVITNTSVAVDDLMICEYVNGGANASSTPSDDSGDGVAWTQISNAPFKVAAARTNSYYKRVSSAWTSSSRTITVTGLTNSCAGATAVYRGVVTSGSPIDAGPTVQDNASGVETHTGITTVTDLAWLCCVAGFSPTGSSTTWTAPFVERFDLSSTGGIDSMITHASYEKTPAGAGANGVFNASINRASGSIMYALLPQGAAAADTSLIYIPRTTLRMR